MNKRTAKKVLKKKDEVNYTKNQIEKAEAKIRRPARKRTKKK